jgi:afadin
MQCFERQPELTKVYATLAREKLDGSVKMALQGIVAANRSGNATLPAEVAHADWESAEQLAEVLVCHIKELEDNLSPESLTEVVDRITAAMPSVGSSHVSPRPNQLGGGGQKNGEERMSPMTPTDPAKRRLVLGDANVMSSTADGAPPLTSTPGSVGGDDDQHGDEMGETPARRERPGMDPLPQEWEELVDQETNHRFFANHATRQTSWTDPRDKLETVSLVKGAKGLGLGISGAKRTWDDRLILGIFVSSLVEGAAASADGRLREGDEILEVQGHSLIGVSREYAIGYVLLPTFRPLISC